MTVRHLLGFVACTTLFGMAASFAFSQETNNAAAPPPNRLTIFDEIEDRAERDAFRQVWDTLEPRTKRVRVDAFVERYPDSIVLREAYELGARASAELGDHADALRRARLSLRLLPENPFLLVMTADIAAKQGDLALAERSAREALRQLANADTPSPLAPADWPRLRDHLRATAYLVLGRIAATRGEHAEARRSLLMALSLNPEEIDALYTLAVVQLALGDDRAAAASFAHVMRAPGPLAGAARTSLTALHYQARAWARLRGLRRFSSMDAAEGTAALADACGRRVCRVAGVPRVSRAHLRAVEFHRDGPDVPDLSRRGRHRRFLGPPDRLKPCAPSRARWPAFHRSSRQPERAMDQVSDRLRDWIEVATGLRHAPARFAHPRFSDSIQPQPFGVGELLGSGRWPWLRARGYLALPYDSRRRDLSDLVRPVPHEPDEIQ